MAEYKSRLVNTHFWDDKYTSNLDPIEKLLFLYFLTNPLCNIIGIYEIEIKRIAFDTGIDKEMVSKIIERFYKDKKLAYVDGYIIIKNFIKFQSQGSEKIKIGIKNQFDRLPENIKNFNFDAVKGIDTLSYINTNINTNSNLNSNGNTNSAKAEYPLTFIDELIEIFSKEYYELKGIEYLTSAKDKKAVGMLLAGYKKKNKDADSEKCKNDFKNLFQAACSINDDKFLSQITLPFLNSQINQYLNYIRNGKSTKNNTGYSKGFNIGKNTWYTGT